MNGWGYCPGRDKTPVEKITATALRRKDFAIRGVRR